MSTIHFTPEDIARTRLSPHTRPLVEAVFGAALLAGGRQGARPGEWTRHARARLAAHPPLRFALARALAAGEKLIPVLCEGVPSTRAERESESLPHAIAALREFRALAVAPYEDSVRRLLAGARRRYGRMLADHGLAATLEGMGEGVRWSSGKLTLECGDDDHALRLDGSGLVLVPSVFLARPQVFSWRSRTYAHSVSVLVFPVCPHGAAVQALSKESEAMRSLPKLLGRTRAAVLAQLVRPQSTGGLSEKLQISATTVSEHTSVLRSTGLITTTRASNTVRHEITALGKLMLDSTADDSGVPCRACADRSPSGVMESALQSVGV
ncbi:winged helix-turn-helix domain-containing protein [Streptomyces meridianus]|uniref:Winged helix-turn-helix domain-containing protein n=1 Tax=Streptomyces meridianus TaxID=2938945 RepID=A0ABT0X657_9ACTN|nr:winged helix-turn-helix domain-containing protein [Streptomyces meridianus]MCM2578011.1 winged helix-turn-helix domain-containing protein [Streptomyces meridianus]